MSPKKEKEEVILSNETKKGNKVQPQWSRDEKQAMQTHDLAFVGVWSAEGSNASHIER